MSPVAYVKALAFLSKIAQPPGKALPEQPVTTGSHGAVYDIYEAELRRGHGKVAVLLHGITFEGRRDERLMNFAASLRDSGVTCLVPQLPGLASGRFMTGDVEIISSLLRGIYGARNTKIIILGFSMGATYGLLAAGGDGAEAVSHVIAFGPYHSLPGLVDYWKAFYASNPSGDDDRDNMIYLGLVCAYTMGSRLGIDESLAAKMRSLLDRYCNNSSPEEKEAFFNDYLKRLDPVSIMADDLGPGVARALSPEGTLAGIKARVHCIHDVNDSLVPADHSRAIMAELAASGRRGDRLLCTSLISHVSAAPVARIDEVIGFCRALGPLFE